MDFTTVNIKAMLRIPTIRLDTLVRKLRHAEGFRSYTRVNNIISIRGDDRLRYVIFERRKRAPGASRRPDQTCNVTGVRTFSALRDAIDGLAKLIGIPTNRIRFNINNITVLWRVTRSPHNVHSNRPLLSLAKLGDALSKNNIEWKHSPEMHSGLVARSTAGVTAMIYRSRKVVFVGANRQSVIEEFARELEPLICSATTTELPTCTNQTPESAETADKTSRSEQMDVDMNGQ